jgi:hypothetical protein
MGSSWAMSVPVCTRFFLFLLPEFSVLFRLDFNAPDGATIPLCDVRCLVDAIIRQSLRVRCRELNGP